MMRSHLIFCAPSRVSTMSQPGSTSDGVVSVITLIRPLSRASISSLTLAALARAKSAPRLRMVTMLPCSRIGGEAERILDAGVARADHGDMLVDIFAGIVELVLDVRQVGAVAAHQVGIALGADRRG